MIILLGAWPVMLSAEAGTITVSTGVAGTHSAARIVSAQPQILAEARILARGDMQVFIVELAQTGGAPVTIGQAFIAAQAFDFEPAPRAEAFCTGAGRCRGTHLGTLFFSQTSFAQAGSAGISVRLNTSGAASIDLALPPALFAEAWAQATWLN
ncbi:MAG: hypothetical protein AAGA70_09815 [Pseudomonadota bacterium]